MTAQAPLPVSVHTRVTSLVISLGAIIFIAGVTLIVAFAAILLALQTSVLLGLFIGGLASFMAWLLLYVGRDLRGKWGWRIEVHADRVDVVLPKHRSLIHHAPAVTVSLPASQIACIETRLEAYRSMGMANMQRAYVLRLTDGTGIFLGEDRALGTGLASSLVAQAQQAIVAAFDIPVQDLGMAKGQGGFLAVLFSAPPAWDAPALSSEDQARMWQRAAMTGGAVGIVPLIVLFAAFVSMIL